MLRMLIGNIWTAANTLLNSSGQNAPPDQQSKWRTIGRFIFSVLSKVGIPFIGSITQNEALYECVNTLLSNSTTTTTTRNPIEHRQQHNSNLSRYSRPNFRRRSRGTVRIIKPTIHVHIH